MKGRFSFLLSGIVFSVSGTLYNHPVEAKPKIVPPTVSCTKTFTFNIDSDPKGLNLRSGPGKQYPVIDTLPFNSEKEGPPANLTGTTGKWLYVEIPGYYGEEEPLKGWVYNSMLATRTKQTGTVSLLKEPNLKSGEMTKIPADSLVKISSCQKEWIQVEYDQKVGWISHDSQCYFYGCKKQ